jgi:hypothetical protein
VSLSAVRAVGGGPGRRAAKNQDRIADGHSIARLKGLGLVCWYGSTVDLRSVGAAQIGKPPTPVIASDLGMLSRSHGFL